MSESIVYNEDCMVGMARYPDKYFDLAIADPPYGNASDVMKKSNTSTHIAKRSTVKGYNNIAPDNEYFKELERVSKRQIIWGANFFGLKGGYICWNKFGTAFGEAELAYDSGSKTVRIFEYVWNGMLQGNMKNKETRIHVHQKPVALYRWILDKYGNSKGQILDTHLGSGSSRIACDEMGFDFTGFELDKDYYEAQEKRFKEYKSQTKLEFI